MHLLAAEYRDDVGRRDLAVGLLSLIDALLDAYNLQDADALVHMDSSPMYSTLSLETMWRGVLGNQKLGISDVIIFNLPALDPENMLLAPLLAHEAAHVYIDRAALRDQVLTGSNADAVRDLIQSVGPPLQEAKTRLADWLDELLCDNLAVSLMGPAFLYAAASFLPASAPLVGDTHPHSSYRVSRIVARLRDTGWGDYLENSFPQLHTWCESLPMPELSIESPLIQFLRKAVELLEPAISAVELSDSMSLADYSSVRDAAKTTLAAGIPATAYGAKLLTPWQLLLASWEIALENHGSRVEALSIAVSDAPFNAFISKNVELVRVTQLWKSYAGP